MAFTWQISIYESGGAYIYDPPTLANVQVGDLIIWSNKDDKAHWPGLKTNGNVDPTYFMPYQIAPHSPSTTFVPGVAGNVTYVDSLDPSGPTGTIEVSS